MARISLAAIAVNAALVASQAPPMDWAADVAAGNMLWTNNESAVQPGQFPSVGNGFVAYQLNSTQLYASGIFNGVVSYRAHIPSGLSCLHVSPPGGDSFASAISVSKATYYRRSYLQPEADCGLDASASCTPLNQPIVVEQRWYAHRALPSVMVLEVMLVSGAPDLDVDVDVSAAVGSTPGAGAPIAMVQLQNIGMPGPGTDFNFTVVSLPSSQKSTGQPWPYTISLGWTHQPENNITEPNLLRAVAVLGSNLTNPSTQYGLWPMYAFNTTLTFLTVTRTDLETPVSGLVDAVQADYAVAVALANQGTLHSSHIAEWETTLWSSGFETDNLQLARVANTSLYAILSSVRSDRPYSLSPGGLSGDGYSGHSFWDCETWMFVPTNLLYPDIAASLLQYRYRTMDGARHKAQTYNPPYNGTMFAWESAVTGQEQAPAPWGVREIHITSDIAIALWQFWSNMQDLDLGWLQSTAWPLYQGIAAFWMSRLTLDNPNASSTDPLHIVDCMDPDEYADGITDGAWTNAGAILSLHYAASTAQLLGYPSSMYRPWLDAASRIVILFNGSAEGPGIVPGGYHPEYATYYNGTVKQADVIMLGFPMGFNSYGNMTTAARANDLEWYGRVTDPNGPAMTWALFVVGYAELDRFADAAALLPRSYETVQEPFGVWYETTGGGADNFITGAGGFLQAAYFGYTRLRINSTAVSLNPTLPPGSTVLKLRGIAYLGQRLDIGYNATNVTVTLQQTPPPVERSADEASAYASVLASFNAGGDSRHSCVTMEDPWTRYHGNDAAASLVSQLSLAPRTAAHTRSQVGRVLVDPYNRDGDLGLVSPQALVVVDANGVQYALQAGTPLTLPNQLLSIIAATQVPNQLVA